MTIISHKHRFIHMHNPKTAGSTVEFILSKYCNSQDVITPEFEDIKKVLGFQQAVNYKQKGLKFKITNDLSKKIALNCREIFRPQMGEYHSLFFHPKSQLGRHSSANHVKNTLGKKLWNEYFKFSIIREPVAQFKSFYRYRNGTPLKFDVYDLSKANQKLNFSDFTIACSEKFFNLSNGITIPNTQEIHFLKFENLSQDLIALSKKVGIPNELPALIKKYHFRKSKKIEISVSEEDRKLILKAAGPLADLYQEKSPSAIQLKSSSICKNSSTHINITANNTGQE